MDSGNWRHRLTSSWSVILLLVFLWGLASAELVDPAITVPVLIDAPPTPAAIAPPRPIALHDVVHLASGAVVFGSVHCVTDDGHLEVTAKEQFEGTLRIRTDALTRLTLRHTRTERTGDDFVQFTNGDWMAGKILAISEDRIRMDTPYCGEVNLTRCMVAAVGFGTGALGTTTFGSGSMGPWQVVSGTWAVLDGKLALESSDEEYYAIAMPVDQSGRMTFQATIEAASDDEPCVSLVLFSSAAGGSFGTDAVVGRFADDEDQYDLGSSPAGEFEAALTRDSEVTFRQATIRLDYDPETRVAAFWIDDKLIGQHAIPAGPQIGSHVLFNSYYPCRISQLTVGGGVPLLAQRAADKNDQTILTLTNGDTVSARGLTMGPSGFTMETGTFGNLACALDRVRHIRFGETGLETPRLQNSDVVAVTAASRLTVQLTSLSGTELHADSEHVGTVTISREALREVRFNLYQRLAP